jgi:transglutaminase-like putative cysteine protease
MTAVAAPPAGAETARDQVDGPPAVGLDAMATIGMIAYSVAVSVGFSRVFTDWTFLRDLVVIAVVGHGSSYLLRRLRVPAVLAIPLVLVVLTWLVAWMYYPDTFSSVFPLADTWEAARADFVVARDDFQSSTAPVDYSAGWAFLAGATTAASVWLADTFAFRAQARGESLVPGAVVFVFIAALGVDENRAACSLAVIGAGYCALALLRQRLERRPRTTLGRAPHPLALTIPAALVAGAVVMAGAYALGPRLPGAGAEPLVDTGGEGTGSTDIVSPLVDIRSRLVNDAEDELFVMQATAASYWRISTLPRFEDDRWELPEDPTEDDPIGPQIDDSERNDQLVTIIGLGGHLVPAAPEPFDASGINPLYNAFTASIFKSGSTLDEGDQYSIASGMPRHDADELRSATSSSPPDPMFLELPDDLPSQIAATAVEVTAGQSTSLDQMVALQNWFRTNFTYTTDVPEPEGDSAIVSFLDNRLGYCEQFAGTFAVMARTLGLPSRVAVGFTQGESQGQSPDGGPWLVRGRNAHAWPEIWFDGYGWVPFEPTPGRGMPGAEAYTGVSPQQDTGEPPPPATTTTTTTTTVAPTTLPGQTAPPTTPPPATPPPTTVPPVLPPDSGSSFPWLLVAGVIGGVALALATPALVRRWRRRRRGPTTDPAHALLELWDRALAALGAIGFRAGPALTPTEISEAAAAAFPSVAAPMSRLADVATSASYAPSADVAALAADDRRTGGGDTPHDWCEYVEAAVESSLTLRERVRRYFTVWH